MVHWFNASGFTTFEQPPNPKGRLPIITGLQLRALIDIALSSSTERGLPFSAWTVPKLAEYCRRIYRYLRYRNRRAGRLNHPLTRIPSVRPIKLGRH